MLAIYTTELTAANAHLMPWRTILEVAAQWQKMGATVVVFSGDNRLGDEILGGVRVSHVARPRGVAKAACFAARLKCEKAEKLFFPVSPGSLYVAFSCAIQRCGIGLVWYYPGAWYTLRYVLPAAKVMSPRALRPYAIQALVPKRLWLLGLRWLGAHPVIAMTPFTAERLRAAGYPDKRVLDIPPGRAPVACGGEASDACLQIERVVGDARFFLFFGPPNPIRGTCHLLDAFAAVCRTHPAVRLVCLFRGDGNVDATVVREHLARLDLGDRLIAHWRSVGSADLDRLLKRCYAVLKPFMIVPSEIPLAVIETAEYGKPVIGFEGDGTGAFIGRFGLLARHGDSGDLANVMRRLLDEPALYAERCRAARDVYAAHPGWPEVAERWLWAGVEGSVAEVVAT